MTDLNDKTVAELRAMCVESGIVGMSRKRKDVIISAIIKNNITYANKSDMKTITKEIPLSALHGSFQSNITDPLKSGGDRITTFIRISCGASSGDFGVAGKTVGAVAVFLKEALNIPDMSNGIVNGREEEDSYILVEGDVLEFIKPAGDKGVTSA